MTTERPASDRPAAQQQPVYPISTIIFAEREGKILLLKRATDAGFGGQWFMPGGAVDAGEGPEEAAIRELREESGLDVVGELELVGAYLAYFWGRDVLLLSYRAEVDGEVAISSEHEGEQWIDPVEMRALMTDEMLTSLAAANQRSSDALFQIRADLDRYIRKIGRVPD